MNPARAGIVSIAIETIRMPSAMTPIAIETIPARPGMVSIAIEIVSIATGIVSKPPGRMPFAHAAMARLRRGQARCEVRPALQALRAQTPPKGRSVELGGARKRRLSENSFVRNRPDHG